ncbi:MAG TPA: hypothetical protein VJV78_06995 [Polyangiales bacterium]|nr:hypothetical protein [Polyangiales bacterium]
MSSSDIDNTAKRARRAVYDPRFARAHDGSVTKPAWRLGQPTAVPAASERRAPSAAARGTRNWPLWIVIAVGSAALVTAGYLGALVQLGSARSETPASVEHSRAPSPPAESAAPAPVAPTLAAPAPLPPPPVSVEHAATPPEPRPQPARAEASAPKPKAQGANVHSTNAEAAALATAALERELYGEQSPVVTVRALPQAEAPEPSQAQPSREAVQQVLLAMRPQLESCAVGRHGAVDAALNIAGSGRVTYTLIRGVFAGTPEGSCMARALRAATFPAFSGPVFKVQFPFAL